jgi:hypothetical protein
MVAQRAAPPEENAWLENRESEPLTEVSLTFAVLLPTKGSDALTADGSHALGSVTAEAKPV